MIAARKPVSLNQFPNKHGHNIKIVDILDKMVKF